jgi:hypothetical protein
MLFRQRDTSLKDALMMELWTVVVAKGHVPVPNRHPQVHLVLLFHQTQGWCLLKRALRSVDRAVEPLSHTKQPISDSIDSDKSTLQQRISGETDQSLHRHKVAEAAPQRGHPPPLFPSHV